MRKLEELREDVGKSFLITSGYRCDEHNASVGGVMGSAHTKGRAADVACFNGAFRFRLLLFGLSVFDRVGVAHNFIHVDNDDTKSKEVVWTY